MNLSFTRYVISILLMVASLISYAQSSIFSNGQWLKIEVEENSITKLTYADLRGAGLPIDGVDPGTIQIFGSHGGMLPQENDSTVLIDPEEIAIQVVVTDAGIFQEGDYILFYSEGPNYINFDRSTESIIYSKHHFTNSNFYFVTVGQNTGKRIADQSVIASGDILAKGVSYEVHELELSNLLHSGREWYGEKFDLTTTISINTALNNIVNGSELSILSSVMSASTETSSFDVSINSVLVGSQSIAANPGGTYSKKGTISSDLFTVSQSLIGKNASSVDYKFNKSSGVGYLDFFILQAEIDLIYERNPLFFFTSNYAKDANRKVQITGTTEDLIVWDITNPAKSLALEVETLNGTTSFNISYDTERIIAFNPNDIPANSSLATIANQDLKSVSQSDLLIITTNEFISSAQDIKSIKESEGITTTIATADQIYNEFASGKKDITAIRNYAKYLYENAGLKHLLIFGKGTYDPKNIIASDLEKIPIYQSRNSLFPLATFSSDDYLGFMEDNEGYWAENGDNDHTLDIGVGRIPVATVDEANIYVEKSKTYTAKTGLGDWRQKVVFVAENGDANIHQRDAERLTTLIDTTYEAFTTNKIYVDAYPIDVNPGSKRAPEANIDIYDAINSGALIVNYTGHGNELQWANTKIFDVKVIDSLLNDSYLPLFVTATCEFGRHDDTGTRSGGEKLLLLQETGAIATITTARPVFASSNYQLNQAFYKTVFEKIDGRYQQLGDIFKQTKNNSLNGVLNRNFSLLGDPSLTLTYGEQFISLDSLNGSPISPNDTLKSLEVLEFSGSIRNTNQALDPSFQGIANIKLFDKSREKKTLGNQGDTPFTYSVRDNTLFSGSSSIVNGQFNFSAVLPKDISYNPATARVVLYAQSTDSTSDASGANINFLIGSSSKNELSDNTPPEINAFLGDTTFNNGAIVNQNSLLIVKLYDEYGINTSSSQVGHSITYQLNDNDPISLNEFYSTEIDDYTRGRLYYNLPKLSTGNHTLKVTAWDTSNNSNTEEIEFIVIGENQIVISNLSNYPNPMREITNFNFSHNLSGENIEVKLEIINTSGQRMYSETRTYDYAPGTISDWEWDGRTHDGGKLRSGIYIYGLFIRSNSSGVVQNQFSRLFISN